MLQFTLARSLLTPLGYPPGRFFDPIFEGSRSPGAEFLTYSDRSCRFLSYGIVYFRSLASNPARPPLREGFVIPHLCESKSLGAGSLKYSDRARRVLPNGIVYFGSLASNPARSLSEKVF